MRRAYTADQFPCQFVATLGWKHAPSLSWQSVGQYSAQAGEAGRASVGPCYQGPPCHVGGATVGVTQPTLGGPFGLGYTPLIKGFLQATQGLQGVNSFLPLPAGTGSMEAPSGGIWVWMPEEHQVGGQGYPPMLVEHWGQGVGVLWVQSSPDARR